MLNECTDGKIPFLEELESSIYRQLLPQLTPMIEMQRLMRVVENRVRATNPFPMVVELFQLLSFYMEAKVFYQLSPSSISYSLNHYIL